MPMDMAGAALIGGACSMLLVRVLTFFVKRREINEARQMHFTDKAREERNVMSKIKRFMEHVPIRLRYGLALGALSTTLGLAPLATQWLMGSDSSAAKEETWLARTAWVAGKWLVLGSVVQQARRWGLAQMRTARAP